MPNSILRVAGILIGVCLILFSVNRMSAMDDGVEPKEQSGKESSHNFDRVKFWKGVLYCMMYVMGVVALSSAMISFLGLVPIGDLITRTLILGFSILLIKCK